MRHTVHDLEQLRTIYPAGFLHAVSLPRRHAHVRTIFTFAELLHFILITNKDIHESPRALVLSSSSSPSCSRAFPGLAPCPRPHQVSFSHTHTRAHIQCTGVPTATSPQCHAQHANTERASRHDHQKDRGVGEEGEGGMRQTRSRVHGEVGHLPVDLEARGQRVAGRRRQ